jgi:hypothetical protein
MSWIRLCRAALIIASVCATVCLVSVSTANVLAAEEASVQLRVERSATAGVWEVWVDVAPVGAEAQSVMLRQTRTTPEPGRAGMGPAGEAAFADWSEAGRRWAAHSRDGGETWSEARPVATALKLRDGDVSPGQPLPAPAPGLGADPGQNLYLVQFRTVVLPEWREAVAAAGVRLRAFFPHNAFLAQVPPAAADRIRGFSFVERIEPYHPWYRISAELRDWLEIAAPEQTRRVRALSFDWGLEGKLGIADRARELGAQVVKLTPNGHVVELEVAPHALRALAAHPDLLWVDPWTPRETDMDLVREDAGTNWVEDNFGFCGQGVRGEVLDNGIQEDHMDFDGILLHGSHDTASHGTNTFGIVFGNGDRDGDGEAKGTGHMPCSEAQGIFADYGPLGDRFAHTQELKEDPYFASFQTNSWGNARTRSYNSYSQEMDDIIWRLDIAILQSQSNAGNQDSRPQAWAKNIISVGGIRHKNTLDTSDDEWDHGASIGPAEDGRIKPDVNYWYDSIYTTTTGNDYTSGFGGTSAATPESAGVLGLMVQMWSENVWGTDPEGNTVFERQPHFSTLKGLLINNAQQYSFTGTDSDLTRVHQGWGRPSARLAKERAEQSFIVDEEQPLLFGETASYDVDVETGSDELKITMVYPDPPGPTSATLHRINDLNLRVTAPDGTVYHGNNGLDAGNYSTPGGSPNDVDTVENVFVDNPASGLWTVEVEAAEINEDAYLDTPEMDAAFALIVTGGSGQICDPPTVDFTIDPNPTSIGEEVAFDSTVSGGAGGPYTYAWDFNGDEEIDSTEADPVYVYHRPYDGPVTLVARDVEECPGEAENPITVTGPDVRYDGYTDLTEIEGNGNGKVDPGEVWDLTVLLRNDGDELAGGVDARLVVHGSTPGPVAVLSDAASYGDIAVGASVAGSPAFRFQVGQSFPCGRDIVFSVVDIESSSPVNRYPDEQGVIDILCGGAGPVEEFHYDGFESDAGWSAQGGGEWQQAAPQGRGSSNSLPGGQLYPDPTAAQEGTKVAGTDLTGLGVSKGDYESEISSTFTSPPIDSSGAVETELEFGRWLNVLPDDRALVQVSADGNTWRTVFDVTEGLTEGGWTPMSFDVSDEADLNPAFRVRFRIESDNVATASGWNIDSLRLYGVTKDSCEPLSRTVPGAVSGLTITKSAAGELDLGWSADCGAGTVYGLYRGDLTAGYSSVAPVDGRCNVSGTSATLTETELPATFFLVVPNDGSFEGSYGVTSSSARRDAAVNACHPRDQVDACAP